MDPNLRPSFVEIVRHLEEILARLKVEQMEHERVQLSGDNDKKTMPKGNCCSNKIILCDSGSFCFHFSFTLKISLYFLFVRRC